MRGLRLALGVSSPSGGGGAPPAAVPVKTVAPVVSGTATVGSLLSTTDGTWINGVSSYAYQWQRNGTNIGGATSSTYTLVTADGGNSITAIVTASNGAGAGSPATSNAVAVAAELPLQGSIIARWRASDLSQSTGSSVTSWADSVNAFTATPVGTAPTFQNAGFNGKKTVRFNGSSAMTMGRPAALVAVLDSTRKTIITIVANTGATTYGFIFAGYNAGGNSFASANGTRAGMKVLAANQSATYSASGLSTIAYRTAQGATYSDGRGMYINGGRVWTDPGYTTSGKEIVIGGSGNNQAGTGYSGDIMEIIVYDGEPTPAEMIQIDKYAIDTYGTPGAYRWTVAGGGNGKFYICDGDSQTEGLGTDSPDYTWPRYMAASLSIPFGAWTNLGASSIPWAAMTTRAPTMVDPIPAQIVGSGAAILSVFEYYNVSTSSPPIPYNAAVSYLTGRRTANPTMKIAIGDSLDAGSGIVSPTWQVNRAAYNASISSNYATYADAYAVLSANANVGVAGSAAVANTYWQSDLIHETGTSAANNGHKEVAGVFYTAVAPL